MLGFAAGMWNNPFDGAAACARSADPTRKECGDG